MRSPADIFLTKMENFFGFEPEFYKGYPPKDNLPTPTVLVFKNVPEMGYMTCITFGLSLVTHPTWKLQRKPELLLVVNTMNLDWAITMGDLVSEMRGKFPFSYGQRITYPLKITEESEMDGFLLFAPAILESKQYLDIDIGQNYKICLTGIYPVKKKELEVIDKIGLEKFWKSDDFDFLNIYR